MGRGSDALKINKVGLLMQKRFCDSECQILPDFVKTTIYKGSDLVVFRRVCYSTDEVSSIAAPIRSVGSTCSVTGCCTVLQMQSVTQCCRINKR